MSDNNINTMSDSQSDAQTPRSGASELFAFARTLFWIIIVVIFLRASVIEPFKIPSGSMIPTLQIGDHIFVSKFNYGIRFPFVLNSLWMVDTPSRGHIVVFTRPDDPASPENDEKINIIKRVVGLPGETLEVRGTKVLIDNVFLDEPYARWQEGGIADFGPMKIPEGRVFLMGDNRDHSRDSRFWTDHFLDMRRIKGRALFIYWNWRAPGRIGSLVR